MEPKERVDSYLSGPQFKSGHKILM